MHLRWILLAGLALGCNNSDVGDEGGTPAGEGGGPGGKADVTVGPVDSIVCKAAESFVRVGGLTAIEVDARDAKGAQSRNYEVTVSPQLGTRVAQRNKVIFNNEGSFQIACCARDSGLCDQTAVQVGRLAPALSVEAPRFAVGRSVNLTGRATAREGKVAKLTINGVATEVEADGSFEALTPVDPGPNTFVLVAKDAAGETTTRYVWVLGGPFVSLDEPPGDGVQVFLGADAYGEFAEIVQGALRAFIDGPEFQEKLNATKSGSSGSYSWTMTPSEFRIEDIEFDLRPDWRGIFVQVVLKRPVLTAHARTKYSDDDPEWDEDWVDRDVRASAYSIVVEGLLMPQDLGFVLNAVDVDVTDLELDIDGIPGFIVYALESYVEDELADSIREAVGDSANEKLGGVAMSFAGKTPLELPEPLSGTLVAEYALTRIQTDEAGLHLALSLTADGETDPLRVDAPGYLKSPTPEPLGGHATYEAAIGTDALNAVLYAAWQTGGFDLAMSFGADELTDSADVSADALDLLFDFELPPQVTAGERPGELLLHLGGVRLDAVYETNLGLVNTAVEIGATLVALVSVRDGVLEISSDARDLDVDVRVPPLNLPPEPARAYLERVLERTALPKLTRVLRTLPIPNADLSELDIPEITRLRAERLRVLRSESGLHLGGELVLE